MLDTGLKFCAAKHDSGELRCLMKALIYCGFDLHNSQICVFNLVAVVPRMHPTVEVFPFFFFSYFVF